MISLRYQKYIHMADFVFFFGDKSSMDLSLSANIIHTGDPLTAPTNRRGMCRVTRALFTAHNWGSLKLSIFDDTKKKKNCSYHRNSITKNLSGFETVTYPNRGLLYIYTLVVGID